MLTAFLIALPILALVALEVKGLLNAVIILGAFSLVLSLAFYFLHAPDVAIVEAAIGAGFLTIIFIIAIRKRGALIVLACPHSRLFFWEKGRPGGMDYEILSLFAKKKGFELEVKILGWEELIPNLIKGEGDIVAGGLTILKEREVLFSRPYLPTKVVLVGRRGVEAENIEKVITVKGTSYEKALKEGGYKIDDTYTDPNMLLKAVVDGKADVCALDLAEAMVGSMSHPVVILKAITDIQHYGYGVAPDKKDLLEELNSFLEEIEKDGTLMRIYKKYFR
jgi:ABC-type amino acid transport substrate-binding protein